MTTSKNSFTKIDNCILQFLPQMKGSTLKVYLILAHRINHSRGDNKSFPSYTSLMNDTGIANRNGISEAIKELEKLGLLEVIRQHKHCNIYLLRYPEMSTKIVPLEYENDTQMSTKSDTVIRINNKNQLTTEFSEENSTKEISISEDNKLNIPPAGWEISPNDPNAFRPISKKKTRKTVEEYLAK